MTPAPFAPRRVHWWFVCTSALIIVMFLVYVVGAVIVATRTNDHDGMTGLMLIVAATMILYPMMPVYAEIVQDRQMKRRRAERGE